MLGIAGCFAFCMASDRIFKSRRGPLITICFACMAVMLATLGPGVLRGDRFVTAGRVGPGAALTVCAQMATPVFPGAVATLDARWQVGNDARLCLIGAPVVPLPGSRPSAGNSRR